MEMEPSQNMHIKPKKEINEIGFQKITIVLHALFAKFEWQQQNWKQKKGKQIADKNSLINHQQSD